MDFDQLETFLEVARHSSFSRAAEKRFRTQPAISSQIRALEEEVGAKLLDRSGGKVSITASGKLFQKYAEDTLEARKAVLTAIAETERVPRGEIIVGANEGTCLHILPEVFAEFKKQYPDVAVNITRADYGKILDSVIDNSVDFGVISLPVTDTRLTVVLIHRDELVIIAPPQHPLAKMKSASVCEVAKFPLVMPKAGHTRDALEELFHEQQTQAALRHGTRFQRTAQALRGRRCGRGVHRPLSCAGGRPGQRAGRDPYGGDSDSPRPSPGLPQGQGPQPRRLGLHRHYGEDKKGRPDSHRNPLAPETTTIEPPPSHVGPGALVRAGEQSSPRFEAAAAELPLRRRDVGSRQYAFRDESWVTIQLLRLKLPPGSFNAYLFDCDGTIADSMPLHYRMARHASRLEPLGSVR